MCASEPSLIFCGEYFRDSIDDIFNRYRKTFERFENRFITHGKSLLEQYQQGRFTVICDLDISPAAFMSGSSIARDNPRTNNNFFASLVFCPNVKNGIYLPDWDQQPVLVENVETVQGPEGIIPTKVGFYDIHNEVSDCFAGLGYTSALYGTCKFIPSRPKRESSVIIVGSKPSEDDFIDRQVEGRFQVMECITDQKREVVWNGFDRLRLKKIISSILICVDAQNVTVSCKRKSAIVKIVDVLLGPFDL